MPICTKRRRTIFILLSIKTRIETPAFILKGEIKMRFLSYYPLKQGLKLLCAIAIIILLFHFYPTIH